MTLVFNDQISIKSILKIMTTGELVFVLPVLSNIHLSCDRKKLLVVRFPQKVLQLSVSYFMRYPKFKLEE